MKLQTKLILSFGLMLVTTFVLIEIYGYQQTRRQILMEVRQDAMMWLHYTGHTDSGIMPDNGGASNEFKLHVTI